MTNRATSRFPAILIGGPPHAGKSVLAHSLKEALARAGVEHYLLRAAPDGEGDWFHEAAPTVAQAQRRKGKFTPSWVEQMCHDIAYRPLPFLVDVGGKPEPWQEAIFDQCSHAILLVKDASSQAEWQAIVDKYNVPVIAILTSQVSGQPVLEAERPVLRGIITNLERGQMARGPVFEALLARVQALFNYSYDELLNIHRQQAPTDLVVDLATMYKQLQPGRAGYRWQPQDLPDILEYLPQHAPLALYGRGPAWLYAAVANYIYPNQFYQFDARRGWVGPAQFKVAGPLASPVTINTANKATYLHIRLDLPNDYLDYQAVLAAQLPPVPETQGVILDGKLPIWLYTGLARYYRNAPWVALYYPQRNQAIVIASQKPGRPYSIGQTRPWP